MAPKVLPTARLLADLERSAATVKRCEGQLAAARDAHRARMLAALNGGVTKAEMARRLQTSETRIRHAVNRAMGGS